MAIRFALYLGVGLFLGMEAREYARAYATVRIGDMAPKLYRRLSLDPKTWFDPFGSGLLPGLVLILFAASVSIAPPFAYGKPPAISPNSWRQYRRDTVTVSVAGPVANVLLAIPPAVAIRGGVSGEARLLLFAIMFSNVCLAVIHLLPVPGLDGGRMVELLLSGRAREVFHEGAQFLPLIALAFFVFFGVILRTAVFGLANALCHLLSGGDCVPFLS